MPFYRHSADRKEKRLVSLLMNPQEPLARYPAIISINLNLRIRQGRAEMVHTGRRFDGHGPLPKLVLGAMIEIGMEVLKTVGRQSEAAA